jgi:flavin-dependent dehydrogenase
VTTTADLLTGGSFDVAVVGAGPAGSATARHLALDDRRVVLIERSRFDTPRVGESLAPAVQPLLVKLGVWSRFLALGPLPSYGTRSLWGDSTPGVHSHLMSAWGRGWHVDRLAFDRLLVDAAVEVGATVACGTAVVGHAWSGDGWQLDLRTRGENGRDEHALQIQARTVVDATGRGAHLATSLGARRLLFDHLVGVAAQLEGITAASERYVMVETTPDGWWYTAPVPNDRMIAMLMTDGDLCRRDNLRSRAIWQSRLNLAHGTLARIASGRSDLSLRVFSAMSQRLHRDECAAPWLAVGDAALAVDPISGSGVVRALRSAGTCSTTIRALLDGQGAGEIAAYEANIDRDCTTYLEERALYYDLEQRWPTCEFWQRRARHPGRTVTS